MKQYYLSEPIFKVPVSQIDRDNGIIKGVTVARIGPARGHGGEIDKTFLLQLVEQANLSKAGIKARFGHPNMCSTALGTYLGRFHNYSFNGNAVTADLHLDPSSKTSPNGNLFDYVLTMAETNPDMFGASIAFESDAFDTAEIESEGTKKTVNLFRLKELRATDIVDDPAATNGLFSADTLPGQATAFLDQNPELTELIFNKPESVIEFLQSYLINSKMNLSDKIIENFKQMFNSKPIATPETPETSVVASVAPVAQFAEVAPMAPMAEVAQFASVAPSLLETAFSNLQSLGVIAASEIPVELDAKTALVIEAFEQTLSKLGEAEKQISLLNAKLSAKPTIPVNVTDPQVSVNLSNTDKDETGKQILSNIPQDLRFKLRKSQPINP
jgi:hypothetical protein